MANPADVKDVVPQRDILTILVYICYDIARSRDLAIFSKENPHDKKEKDYNVCARDAAPARLR